MEQRQIDPDHTVAAFEVRHFWITLVRGQFNRITGTLRFDPEAPALGSVEAVIEAAGVYTGIPKRDEHLRSPDFLYVGKFPFIRFKSSGIVPSALNRFVCNGDLTIRDTTRPVSLEVEYLGRVKSPFDADVSCGFSATARVDRRDFGVNWNYDLENGGLVAGNELLLRLEAEADLV